MEVSGRKCLILPPEALTQKSWAEALPFSFRIFQQKALILALTWQEQKFLREKKSKFSVQPDRKSSQLLGTNFRAKKCHVQIC